MGRFNDFLNRIAKFLRGRNGMDRMAKDLYVFAVILLVINVFFRSSFFHLLSMIALGYSLFRFLSKNPNKRQIENRNYMVYRNRVFNSLRFVKRKWDDRKVYRYYTCKNCGQKVRVPAGKGNIEITCPKCGNTFNKRT
ncbi:MAG: hypothetical protein IJI46_09670 [Erysipelotrichaceae bacterium]|nr:hypothetical protein [Erysipelotrichaceae bacterium]